MIKQDLKMLNAQEQELLDNSFFEQPLFRRLRNIALGGILLMALACGMLAFGSSATAIAVVFAAYIVIATLEKMSYARTAIGYRKLITKLVRRIERLEGVSLTPDQAEPSKLAEDKAA